MGIMQRAMCRMVGCCALVGALLLGSLPNAHGQAMPDEPAPTPGSSLPVTSRRAMPAVVVAQQGHLADELVRRISAELAALGIASRRSDDAARVLGQGRRLSSTSALASASVIVIEVQPGAVWIWSPSPAGPKRAPVVGRLDELPLAAAERVHALRRAWQGPRPVARAAKDPEVPPGQTALRQPRDDERLRMRRRPDPPVDAPRRWAVAVVGGLLGSAGIGTAATLGIGLSYRWRPWLELDATVIAPLGAASTTTTAGTIDVYAALARVGLALTTDAWGALRPSVGVGVGALLLGLQGTPAPSFEANDSWRVGVAPHLELRLAWQVHARLTITLAGLVGSALPRVTVSAGAKDLDRWGQPFYSLLGGLALRL